MRPKAIKKASEGAYIAAGDWFYTRDGECEIYKKFNNKDTPVPRETYLIEGLESPIMPIELQVGHFYTIQNGNDEFFAEVTSIHGHAGKYACVEMPDGRRYDLERSKVTVVKEWEAVER